MIKILGALLLIALVARGQYPQLTSISSNFDIYSELVSAGGIAPTGVPDVVGAFRFICNPSHLSYDDPVVYPGQPGKSHLHQFYGNTMANYNSTYESLRKSGNSTCTSPLNRSAYWMPAMLNGKGGVVRPDYVSIYYKRLPKTDRRCFQMAPKGCINLPRGLRFLFGYDLVTKSKSGYPYFNCDGVNATSGHFSDIIEAGKNCGQGSRLGAIISAPQCWDGKNLDSANHRDHVAYTYYNSSGMEVCPPGYPYIIPTFTLGAWFKTDSDLNRSGSWDGTARQGWHLSSDIPLDGSPMLRPGTTLHSDWFGAWDDIIMQTWSDNCIDKLLSCSAGDLGNGSMMKMFNGFTWDANPRVVPVPADPKNMCSCPCKV